MFCEDGRGTTLEITVRPHAGKCRVTEASADRVKVSVSAPPEDGKATRQALKTLADALEVPVSAVQLLKGQTSRRKTILVVGLKAAECLAKLQSAAG